MRSSVTILITTYNRPDKLARAVESAKAQTVPCDICVIDDGETPSDIALSGVKHMHTARPDHPYLSWLDGVHAAKTEYIAILHDDDWYEPDFVESCLQIIPLCGFVFSEATIHFPDRTELNWKHAFGKETAIISSQDLGDLMLKTRGIISPATCLYRRSSLLRNLIPGGIPCFGALPYGKNRIISGPDHLLALLTMLQHPEGTGWIADPKVNLDGWDESTTIKELNRDGGARLTPNYDAARWMYSVFREMYRAAKTEGVDE